VVVAIIALVSMLSAPLLADTVSSRDLASTAADAVDAIREAQAATMTGRNAARYGVHFQGDRFVFFQGASYAPADPENVVHTLSGRVTITAVTLSPGGACVLPEGTGNCDLHFADRRGTPTETGSIVMTESGGDTGTIVINAAGMVDSAP